MYLKALEIQGFKSFPDKTVLNFGEDITAIVGPNGSGKSNVSDAIRWVMGEQSSKSLRGAKMEDVIFGGTEKRSQMGFAQVTLVLDNTEHIFPSMEETEVAVTRRYYRSGESEYYINKQSVRLRDVNELFMDTGMGRGGYSIIGQGRIDEILSQKSGDRREIFEEAAGISRFRYRKEETERKLERTEENLVRINDKIAELELQVEPLRAQCSDDSVMLPFQRTQYCLPGGTLLCTARCVHRPAHSRAVCRNALRFLPGQRRAIAGRGRRVFGLPRCIAKYCGCLGSIEGEGRCYDLNRAFPGQFARIYRLYNVHETRNLSAIQTDLLCGLHLARFHI